MYKRIIMFILLAGMLAGCGTAAESQTNVAETPVPLETAALPEAAVPTAPPAPPTPVETPAVFEETNEGPISDDEASLSALFYPKMEITYETVLSVDFNDGPGLFIPRGDTQLETVERMDAGPESAYCLKVSGRTATWTGAMTDMTGTMESGRRFSVSAWVRYDEGFESLPISVMLERNGNEYLMMGRVVAQKGVWTELKGDMVIPQDTQTAMVYFETPWKAEFTEDDLCDLYIAEVVITEETAVSFAEDTPPLKEAFADYFLVGTGIEVSDLNVPEIADLVVKHFDTITCGNEMKPDFLLDHAASVSDPQYDTSPVINTERADIIMDFAVAHGLQVRGHTLIWHSQTPRWLFTKNYSTDENAPFVDREKMLLRMENYIRQVLTHFQTKYPGVIFAWDVVNEAIDTADRHMQGYRIKDALWYEVVGQDYIEWAFTYARRYADPAVKLFYNDYHSYISDRTYRISELIKALQEKDLIDGMGMQSHIGMNTPDLFAYESAIRKYGELGVEVHITELDIGLKTNDEAAIAQQGMRYARLSEIYRRLRSEGVPLTSVTVWGVVDNRSWLNADGADYPLLFDKYFQAKPAFWGLYYGFDE